MLINGDFPGPKLTASWGDTIVVHVKNSLTSLNGTSIHFHGLRQLNNSANDGERALLAAQLAALGNPDDYNFIAAWYFAPPTKSEGTNEIGNSNFFRLLPQKNASPATRRIVAQDGHGASVERTSLVSEYIQRVGDFRPLDLAARARS